MREYNVFARTHTMAKPSVVKVSTEPLPQELLGVGRLGKGSGGRLTQAVKVHIGPSLQSREHSYPVCERLWQIVAERLCPTASEGARRLWQSDCVLLLQRTHGVSLFSGHRIHQMRLLPPHQSSRACMPLEPWRMGERM